MPEKELTAFIRSSIRSVWALELLLLMRAGGDRAWTIDDLVRDLRASIPLVSEILRGLIGADLVRDDGDTFSYAPASSTLEARCAELERAYRERPVAIVNLIVAPADDSVQGFADAFRFKGGDK